MFFNSSVLLFILNNDSSVTNGTPDNSTEDCLQHSSTGKTVLKSLAYFVILILSLIGNGCILLVIYKNKNLRRNINYFVLNMAVSDLFNPLTIMPVHLVTIISESPSWRVDNPWILGNILCKLCYFLPDVSLTVSIESLLLISADRFIAVVFPLKARHFSTKVHFICIGCTWIIAIAVHAPYFYTFRLFPYGNDSYQCSVSWEPAFNHTETHNRYVTATFITFVLVPIIILTTVYGTIAWTLKAESKKMQKESFNQQTRLSEQSRKIVRSSIIIITAFGLCMITQLVFVFTRVFVWNWKEPPICAFRTVVPFVATFMLNAWSAVNPCFCFIFIKSYQVALRRVLCCRPSPETHPKSLDLTIHPSTFANSKIRRCRSTRV